MNMLTKWNPLSELSDVQSRLSSLFGRLNMNGNGDYGFTDWSPLIDVSENEKEFVIRAEITDVKKEDVKVSVENGMLRITGERHLEKEKKGQRYHRIERAYGSFERSMSLPDNCKPDNMTAEYKDGMLTLRIPKTAKVSPKAIEVQIH